MFVSVKFLISLLTIGVWMLSGLCSASVGPVFINPANQVVPVNPTPVDAGLFTTQTVYGFLDFTTTIGNTVMVFSPQSAAPSNTESTNEPEPIVNIVIDTTPVNSISIVESSEVIKPTKPALKSEKKASDLNSNQKYILPETSSKIMDNNPVLQNSEVNIVINTVLEEESIHATQNIVTKVEIITEAPVIIASKVDVYEEQLNSAVFTPSSPVPLISSVVEIKTDDEEEQPVLVIGNNIGEPEYDFLSRQPSEVVEETYKVINLKPSSKFHLKPRASADKTKATKRADTIHPTGLVTKLGGTVVKDGVTTVHETSVIGTYISGKYAQVLQSTSYIYNNQKANKISPTPSLRILKTASPALGKSIKQKHLEPTPAGSINEETSLMPDFGGNSIKNSRKPPTGSGGSFKRFKNRQREQELEENEPEPIVEQSYKRNSIRVQAANRSFKQANTSPRKQYGRSHLSTVSVYSADPTTNAPLTSKRYNSRRNKQQRDRTSSINAFSDNSNNNSGFSRRGYKPKVQPTAVEAQSASTSLYKFKLNRSPGRWQYKTTPKPRVTIRKLNDDEQQQREHNEPTPSGLEYVNDGVTPQARSDEVDGLVGSESVASIINDESSTENKIDTPFPLETIKVEISTPPDFKDVYYEIATIKSPYTFQVGSVKNTRYITVTSTYERVLEPTGINEQITPTASEPLTENILATASAYDKDNNFLDSSVATLPPLYLASDMETPPLETLTETFSTTQTMLKTHILPVIRGVNDSSTQTLVQTYLITRLVIATKTLPPMEAYHFIPSRTLNEFNSHLDEAGSELHLELEFGDDNEEEGGSRPKRVFPPDLDLANIGNDFDLSAVDKSKLEAHMRPKKVQITTPKPQIIEQPQQQPNFSPEQLQQLAILRLLNPGAVPQQPLGQVITTSKPVIKVETIYESHVIPIVNGQNTILSTISKIIGTVTKTDYELGTSTLPALPLPPVPMNQFFPSAPQQFALTSSLVIYDTMLTQTHSKILKLTFGAKTTQTTIYSTKVVPTKLSSYLTASIQVQQTIPGPAFPGFFPAPYNPFPYVG